VPDLSIGIIPFSDIFEADYQIEVGGLKLVVQIYPDDIYLLLIV